MGTVKHTISAVITFSLIIITLLGCDTHHNQKRPVGYLRLGYVDELTRPETFLSDLRLLLRMDERGFYVMSTICPYDSSPLKPIERDGKLFFGSTLTESLYTVEGKVVKGPAFVNLPYYKLRIAESEIGGPADGLYVLLGEEAGDQWRLPLPPVAAGIAK